MRIIAQPAFNGENPYTRTLYLQLQRLEGVTVHEFSMARLLAGRYDIWHRHWPDRSLNQPNLAWVLLKLWAAIFFTFVAKWKGIKIVWTVHNLGSHEQYYPRLERWFWRFFLANLDGYLCLSKRSQQQALQKLEALQAIPGEVVYHCHYREHYSNQVDSAAARKTLGISHQKKVLLLLGKLRDYKQIPTFIEQLKQDSDPELLLCVAGSPADERIAAEIQSAAASDERIQLHLSYVPDNAVQNFMNAADLVVVPYREMLNSGAMLLALSFHRPVLSPRMGAASEIAELVGSDWVFTYSSELDAATLSQAINWSLETPRPPQAPMDCFAPEAIAKATLQAYEKILQHRPSVNMGLKVKPLES